MFVENVVVAESGDESEDEWNYIQGNKDASEITETTKSTEDIAISPSPPTASIGEPEIEHPTPEESHAIAQAIVESQESCTEVNEQTKYISIKHDAELY